MSKVDSDWFCETFAQHVTDKAGIPGVAFRFTETREFTTLKNMKVEMRLSAWRLGDLLYQGVREIDFDALKALGEGRCGDILAKAQNNLVDEVVGVVRKMV